MPFLRKTHTTDLQGASGAADFDDKTVIRDINTAEISRVVVTSDNNLRSITVHYADMVGVTHGEAAGASTELTLPSGEYITRVEGTYVPNAIRKIEFTTSKGRKWGPFGSVSATSTFVWDGFGPGMGLLYLSGKSDNYVRALKATFGMYEDPAQHQAGVKYEEHVTTAIATQESTPRSKFTSVLIATTVTLLVGTDKTALNVSQHILCRLPFFRAALQGNFREASEQKVSMPEDELQDVTALVEFLYTDRYTYPYYVTAEPGSGRPTPNLAEGLYHVGVYATAHKYGCFELLATTLDLFMYVLEHLKGIDVIELWKRAYSMNLLLQDVEDNEKVGDFRRGLPGLLGELYTEHRPEMETTAVEYPMLLSDLLRLVMTK